jgi:hypothetical protein
LEKLLEDAGIKLSSLVSDLTGVSGRAMLEAVIAGDTNTVYPGTTLTLRDSTKPHRATHTHY